MVKSCAFLVPTSFVQSPPNERGRFSIKNLKASKMKKLLLFLFLLCSMSAFAQDVIVKKDGSTIVCRVEKVSETDVTYKLWSDLKGSSYVMDKSLVSAINYENGKKEIISELETLPQQNSQYDGSQSMSDADLLRLDEELNLQSIRLANIQKNQDYLKIQKKVKRLKTWGWIGGSILAIGGAVAFGFGMTSDGRGSSEARGGGAAVMALGVGLTTTCLVVAHKKKKQLDALQASSIYRYDIPFSNGSLLSIGADMLNDRIMNKRTVGLGLSYNF